MTEHLLGNTLKYANIAVELADEKQASDIVLLDISKISSFADVFIILTVESIPQMKTIIQDIQRIFKKTGVKLNHKEGLEDSGWVLLDYGDLVVHLFKPEERELFQLEDLWSNGQEIVRIQ
tara:strand:- start:198 stop:560 length:363 start_codon:yes stop_codon:yes gene_type:complete